MGRPKKKIDSEMIFRMAARGCTIEDMAVILDTDRDTISDRFSVEIEKGKTACREKLRDLMWRSAEKGNVVMQIFLSKQKQLLGYTDRQDVELKVEQTSITTQNKRLEEIELEVRTMLLDQPPKEFECLGLISLSPSLETSSPLELSMEASKLKSNE